MRICVVGATSATGAHLLAQGKARGHEMVAFCRRPEALADPGAAAEVVAGDGRDHDAVERGVAGVDTVVSLVGGGNRRDRTPAADVARTVVQAMATVGVRRLVVTSAYPVVAREPRLLIWLLRRVFAISYADVTTMERELDASDLDWTVLRLNRLTGAAAADAAVVSADLLARPLPVSRADVARVILDTVDEPDTVRVAMNVGGATA